MPPPFQQDIRPLPMMKAKVARPTGHQTTKPRIMRAIQAGFPNSSSFATIGMWASSVNVKYIYIATGDPPACQARADAEMGVIWSQASPGPGRADRSAPQPRAGLPATSEAL